VVSLLCTPFRFVDLAARLFKVFNVRKKALRVPVPNWVRAILVVPLLTLAFPLAVLRGGHTRQRIRTLTGEFRDLCDPVKNLALVLREAAVGTSSVGEIVVVHESKTVLRALKWLAALRLVPRSATRLVSDGGSLREAFTPGPERGASDAVILVPSSLYIRYHLEVPAVTKLKHIILV
jgi:hypothetical protein